MPAHLVLRFILLPPEIYLFIIICCMAISIFQKVMKIFSVDCRPGTNTQDIYKKFTTQFTTFSSLRVIFYHSGAFSRHGRGDRTCRLLRLRLAYLWLADRCFATVPVSPLFAKNSPPDCFLNAQTFSGSSPLQIKKSRKTAPFIWSRRQDLNLRHLGPKPMYLKWAETT